ncbi:MAG: dinitrogenase iron-molybdenum cofactor [Candidatus Altiarchaeales archaeon]|nr:MAG: dinitrogenase iron-molybdenum cofactor [Candidatus Altiarchaeales archaeon]
MRICIATNQGGLEDQVFPVFGRCPTFTFVDMEDKEIKNVEVIPNEFAGAMGGAGIQAAQLVTNKGANVVIAGNYGPNAYPILNQAGISVVSAQGNVKEVVMKHVNGELPEITQSTAPRFGGMGMGRGGGRGMGRGRGRGMWSTPAQASSTTLPPQTKEQELQMLKTRVEQLEEQLNEIKKRIDELKK